MSMTPFEKAIINELQGIKKELHELNKKKPEQGQVDGMSRTNDIDMGAMISNSLRGVNHETISNQMVK